MGNYKELAQDLIQIGELVVHKMYDKKARAVIDIEKIEEV